MPQENANNPPGNLFAQDGVKLTPAADKIITVEVTHPDGCFLDGQPVKKGEIVKISVLQWRSLSRFFKWIDGDTEEAKKHNPAAFNPPTGPTHF
jgi:hypothetical protein